MFAGSLGLAPSAAPVTEWMLRGSVAGVRALVVAQQRTPAKHGGDRVVHEGGQPILRAGAQACWRRAHEVAGAVRELHGGDARGKRRDALRLLSGVAESLPSGGHLK
ncbi:hypothetical protein AB870_26450 (plasmid) [Pandoraea faecigallinarum]|uniref:Uncharacterized protein n=1 Tax=Pandoraea faecigallinarum TaxID=656179 RepID=A0A1D8X6M3_9BURK|nr:hypothetical protein AB870_26450 [Pandoraea faecigallinarum]